MSGDWRFVNDVHDHVVDKEAPSSPYRPILAAHLVIHAKRIPAVRQIDGERMLGRTKLPKGTLPDGIGISPEHPVAIEIHAGCCSHPGPGAANNKNDEAKYRQIETCFAI